MIRLSLCRTLLGATYGIPAKDVTMCHADLLSEGETGVSEAYDPAAFYIQWLVRNLLGWLLTAGLQRKLARWRGQTKAIIEVPSKDWQNAVKRGVVGSSMLNDLLGIAPLSDQVTRNVMHEDEAKAVAAAAFFAGTDTILYRLLPEHADRPSLPYINALMKELIRWAILHDDECYPEPDTFKPERFLKNGQIDQDVLDPGSVVFGFGRRFCPGKHFADDTLFINIASVLHAFDIMPALDSQGEPIPVVPKIVPGFVSDLAAQYGDVICVHLVGHPVIVLNSADADADLLEKRSAIYSDRPKSLVSLSRLLHWIWMFSVKPYGDDWRDSRRLLWQSIQPSTVSQWHPIQIRESRHFLQYLLQGNHDLQEAIRLTLCRTLLSAAYGLPAEYVDGRYVDLLREADDTLTQALDPAVMFIPFLRYLPSWFPGGGWKSGIERWRAVAILTRDLPYQDTLQAMQNGKAEPSLLSELLGDLDTMGEIDEECMKGVCSAMFVAGADTADCAQTASLFYAFFCAMVLYPEAQQRAQAELDAIIGLDRLPEHADKPSCPYVSALVKELLRWHPVSPLGVAHRCTEDNVYQGWTIPGDATVMTNIWAIMRDPERFPEPDRFCPERFLKAGELDSEILDPSDIVFGSGRRVCPGRYFAEDTLFINIASVLHVFNITPALNENGIPVAVEYKIGAGLISTVKPFQCSIQPRSEIARSLIGHA
ncbi:hypothetical protein ONZ51_g11007 [Trametes cubensis]|uniref:Cytochrome P450 n=1 Tax=Trametes cubensis TaxID=1111947 RepID=A0AAD7TIS3_9APHY|nr:hypothetical protein ONZ51_g11007 [Trametes cubensis]